MADYFEVDFLGVETAKSGDAIALRYSIGGVEGVHVIDGGYIDTGSQVVDHIEKFYGSKIIDNVVLTHPDSDHANGLRKVLEECDVKVLWMNRPWLYAEELISRFKTYQSIDALRSKLKQVYSASAELERIANEKKIPIKSPFQGERIGPFDILAPSYHRYLELIVDSEKTPDVATESLSGVVSDGLRSIYSRITNLVRAVWGDEYFPTSPTSSENEMSVVQAGIINGKKILFTGDAGRDGLSEAIDYSSQVNFTLPGVNMFQVPHHGGRHNVSTEILDKILGVRLIQPSGTTSWCGICSSAKEDKDHPKNSVKRAILHRGGHWSETEGKTVHWGTGIIREGWTSIPQAVYPEEQED
ncbi:TPA: MBL fold metallo-hydrolase [Klebsiella michiganensis]|nr:MBL fold metallo-hydrolase [Klebsiella michiganensis]ELS4625786.1 MBL fold metallo-hydrolase [Klebsiella michiganensis]HCQ8476901.1 MBL fold metallo-hydrolase [Klebsiella michiganensis]HCU0766856.1 MBL fold metallo-hydrolase [Klebsiella michiganensis]HEP0440768.1 MBL fold metallo-hydrolase [Klebsiella michiganensis]